MKVLLISNKPIFPKNDGGCVAMDNFLKSLLNANLKVSHIAIGTEKHPYDPKNYPEHLRNEISISGHNISTNVSVLKAIKSLFKKGSYNVDRFYTESISKEILDQLKKNNFELVIFESLFSTVYLDDIRNVFNGRIMSRVHNIETDIWKGYWKNESSLIRKVYLKKLYKDLEVFELDIFNRLDGIIAISKDDERSILSLGIKTNIITIPVSINKSAHIETVKPQSSVFHLGAMDWQPNIEAVERLVRIHTEATAKNKGFKLIIAGKKAANFKIASSSKDIENVGFVNDLDAFTKNAGILVSPIISGSGVRIKILEMMGKGIPVITTEIGAKGVNYNEHKCLLIAGNNHDFIEKIQLVRENELLRKELSQNAIKYIEKYHNIDEITKDLREFIQRK